MSAGLKTTGTRLGTTKNLHRWSQWLYQRSLALPLCAYVDDWHYLCRIFTYVGSANDLVGPMVLPTFWAVSEGLMGKRLPAINIRPRESVRARITARVPSGFTEHATILALIELGLRAAEQEPSCLLATLDVLPTRSPTRKTVTIPPVALELESDSVGETTPSVPSLTFEDASRGVSPISDPPLSIDEDAEALAREFG